jgi:uncharacterized 2Fe-2S/4Fe-4S cluster protein (DUF4445 family)
VKVDLSNNFNQEAFLKNELASNAHQLEIYRKELNIVSQQCLMHINPKGYYIIKKDGGITKVHCLVTLGEEIDMMISGYFSQEESLKGYFTNKLADHILFNASHELYKKLKKSGLCLSQRINYSTREEIKKQSSILEAINELETTGVTLTSGYMFQPTKTICYSYELGEQFRKETVDHNCNQCRSENCNMKRVELTIVENENKHVLQVRNGENLLESLQKNGISINADCNGMKACGQCKVKILKSLKQIVPKSQEYRLLSNVERNQNIRLACCHEVMDAMTIEVVRKESESHIMADFDRSLLTFENNLEKEQYGIAIDIGTTTLVCALVNLKTGAIVDVDKIMNPQKAYGSDVVSRIKYALADNKNTLTNLVRDTIGDVIETLLTVNHLTTERLDKMSISCNTTMAYLLLGKDVMSLSRSPYEIEDTGLIEIDAFKLLGRSSLSGVSIYILPWISAFVGGDMTAFMYYVNLLKIKETVLLLDIGTNGEMALKIGDKIFTTSTAAGPAFEGANISCGVGTIKGAIYEVEKLEGRFNYKTIEEEYPVGICGTGLIDLVALLLREGKIDSSGRFTEGSVFDILKTRRISISLTQEDIRQLQLAKAAIATGISSLIKAAGITYEEVKTLYLSGSFGSYVNLENAAMVGLIPKELKDKSRVLGNTSLGGAIKLMLNQHLDVEVDGIKESTCHIDLTSMKDFNEGYVAAMDFD